jgi:DNA replication and repair protein RecF
MWISSLSLINFRNYLNLELTLPQCAVVFQGNNAQGKSNLLEAIYLLATTRSHRATNERELISWAVAPDELAVSHIASVAQSVRGEIKVEIALGERESGIQKRMRVNGVPRRAADVVGRLHVVMFDTHDIELVFGSPSVRRRYLDLIGSQLDSRYLRSIQRYNRVLSQRNYLLRQIGERHASADQLEFWDGELVENGGYILLRRRQVLTELESLAGTAYRALGGNRQKLEMVYHPGVAEGDVGGGAVQLEAVQAGFKRALQQVRSREMAQGMTVVGPHRDEFRFLADGADMGIYGSRGQQRALAFSLKLAEMEYMRKETSEYPVLLLDDVLSELDSDHRHHLLELVPSFQQVLITTTDLDYLEPSFLAGAARFTVSGGCIKLL